MASDPPGADGGPCPRELYERLALADPEARAEIALRLIGEHPGGVLELPARDGRRAQLDEVDFSGTGAFPASALRAAKLRGASLRKAVLKGMDLAGADLEGVALGEADLRGARLEEARLLAADLAGADLRGAALGKANLRGALLEETKLQDADLRFADLRGAALEKADLRGADLWGADLRDATLAGADLRRVAVREADLQGADLSGTQLEGAVFDRVDLRRANFADATLQGVVLSTCRLEQARWSGAWLERTRMQRGQLGDAIGEELAGDYDRAAQGYLALERNFAALGDPDASSWAYRRRRRMKKRAALAQARAALAAGTPRAAAGAFLRYLSDQAVEWLCDYGESVPRVLGSLLALHLAFTCLYGLTGSVVRLVETPTGVVRMPTRDPLDLATFSLLALSTSGSPAVGLQPSDESVHFLTATEAILGIALTGLLGFVIGNRIRR